MNRNTLKRLQQLELKHQPAPEPRVVCIQSVSDPLLWDCGSEIGLTETPPEGALLLGVRDCRDPAVIEAERAANSLPQ